MKAFQRWFDRFIAKLLHYVFFKQGNGEIYLYGAEEIPDPDGMVLVMTHPNSAGKRVPVVYAYKFENRWMMELSPQRRFHAIASTCLMLNQVRARFIIEHGECWGPIGKIDTSDPKVHSRFLVENLPIRSFIPA